MQTITLTDPERATEAGAWAVKNIGYKYWTLNVPPEALFSKTPRYEFIFTRSKDAVLFSLKWL
jgi:hypothetical protein